MCTQGTYYTLQRGSIYTITATVLESGFQKFKIMSHKPTRIESIHNEITSTCTKRRQQFTAPNRPKIEDFESSQTKNYSKLI